jgi:hypothetical protein
LGSSLKLPVDELIEEESGSMLNKVITTLIVVGATTAFAASTYKVNILQNTVVEGKQVKAGDYKISVENNTAVLKHGKDSIEVPAHTEQAPAKFPSTTVKYVDNAINEIHVGGSTTKIVFGGGNGTMTGGSN